MYHLLLKLLLILGSAYDLKTVHIEGCGLRLPCYVTLGDEVAVNVQFYAGNIFSILI